MPDKATITKLAEDAFDKAERVRMLSMMNMPQEYEARRKAASDYALAQHEEMMARHALDDAINYRSVTQAKEIPLK